MRHKYFFRHNTSADVLKEKNKNCCIQIPSVKDLEQMHDMPAGAQEDQFERLQHMTQVITEFQSRNPSLPIINTDQVLLPKHWLQLFAAIKEGNQKESLRLLAELPQTDKLLRSILAVHPLSYLHEVVSYCLQAQQKGFKKLSSDILITPGTFEVLIKDIALTLFHFKKFHFSFGLPTHHAFSEEGSGFCILNKTAILMKYLESVSSKLLKYIVVGTDVNRDNGLCDILMNIASDMDVSHLDIFDSRVYPHHDTGFISELFEHDGQPEGQKIQSWKQNKFEYFAIDLSLTARKTEEIHPAIIFALEKIKEQMEQAKKNHQKVALFLPTGWDSHEEETADCGKYVNGEYMADSEARKTRFNTKDLTYFYEHLFQIYHENRESIEKIYWGLEGGYSQKMYEHQVGLLLSIIMKNLAPQDSNEIGADGPKKS